MKQLRYIFQKSVDSVKPATLVQSAVRVKGNTILVSGKPYNINENIYVVGFGKAVYEMGLTIEQLLGRHLRKGILSVPVGTQCNFPSVLEIIQAGKNNFPDESSFEAAKRIRQLAEQLTHHDLLLVLVSGGGSALLSYPIHPITIDEKTRTIQLLASCGASIVEVNTVRKVLSEVKGGKLARIAHPAITIALILSDIIGDPIDSIASGPTVLDYTKSEVALDILNFYNLLDDVPESVKNVLLNYTDVNNDCNSINTNNFVIGNNSIALEAARSAASDLNYTALVLSNRVDGLVTDLAIVYVKCVFQVCQLFQNDQLDIDEFLVNDCKPLYIDDIVKHIRQNVNRIKTAFQEKKSVCLICGGEPTVKLNGSGKGGRNQEIALIFGIKVCELFKKHDSLRSNFVVSFLSGGTDGIDGPTDAAGAISDTNFVDEAYRQNLDPISYLNHNDSYTFFSKFGQGSSLLKIGHTESILKYEVTEEPQTSLNENNTTVKWMLMPDGRDNVEPAVISGLNPTNEYLPTTQSVQFYLFTRTNPKQAEMKTMNESCLPAYKYFKKNRKTKILIHGFGDSVKESYMVPILRDAFLARGDYNVIAVDWSEYSASPWYSAAVKNTHPVASQVARFVEHMSYTTGTKIKNFHMVGFSLGAHVAGLAANSVKTGRIKHVTGLDPAYVLYSSAGPDKRLDQSHADLVEVVHTSGGYIGYKKQLGHRDFFPNGGIWPQPGCVIDYAVCSHRRAYYYYGEAVSRNRTFTAVSCDSYENYVNKKCHEKYNETIELGSTIFDKKLNGTYFLNTNPNPPFGQRTMDTDYFEEFENFLEYK